MPAQLSPPLVDRTDEQALLSAGPKPPARAPGKSSSSRVRQASASRA